MPDRVPRPIGALKTRGPAFAGPREYRRRLPSAARRQCDAPSDCKIPEVDRRTSQQTLAPSQSAGSAANSGPCWPDVTRCRSPVAECHQPLKFIIMKHTKELLWVPLARVTLSRFYERRHSVDPVEEVLALM